jgi:hypothetical protein
LRRVIIVNPPEANEIIASGQHESPGGGDISTGHPGRGMYRSIGQTNDNFAVTFPNMDMRWTVFGDRQQHEYRKPVAAHNYS